MNQKAKKKIVELTKGGKIPLLRITLILSLFSLPAIASYVRTMGLSPLDLFGVVTGAIAVLMGIYQLYSGMAREESQYVRDELDDTRETLQKQIDESDERCKERFDNQQVAINSLFERVNNLTIDIKSHERLPGHSGSYAQISELREEVAELKATVVISTQKNEILTCFSNLETLLGAKLNQGNSEG
jgi:hypothetical protein